MSHTVKIVLAFGFLYLAWGGSFLAIHIGVSDTPPPLFAGVRFLIAAPLLLAWWRDEQCNIPGHCTQVHRPFHGAQGKTCYQ